MKASNGIRRLYLIIELIRRRKYASFEAIAEHLADQGLQISSRTLQRDLAALRADYQLYIEYDGQERGYFINNDSVLPVDGFLHFLEMVAFSQIMSNSLADVKGALDVIQFENAGALKGVHQLKEILFAIRERRIISFTHESFSSDKMSKVSLKPLLLKEYNSRWYVIGMHLNGEWRTYGVERISELEVTERVFKAQKEQDIKDKFQHVIGLNNDGDRAEVILSFKPIQGKYIKTLPLHESQEILLDNVEELRISLDVVVNYELCQRILMYGENVEVISPKSLRKHIRQRLEENLKQYSN